MDYVKEVFAFQNTFPFRMFQTSTRQVFMHCHDCLEINLIEQGSGYYIIEEKSYEIRPGDIFIINNSERHMAVHNEQLHMLVMIFEPDLVWGSKREYDFLEPFFKRSPHFSNRIRKESDNYLELESMIKKISDQYKNKREGWQMYIKASIMLFLAVLYQYCIHNDAIGGDVQNLHKTYGRIRPVMDYIHEHFGEHITLDDLAKEAMVNKTYLCSFFKSVMNIRVFEYIDQVRVNHACLLLKTTDLSITEIASGAGFNSVSYFNKTFKKILGSSPSVYRKEM